MTEHRQSMRDKEELILQYKSYEIWRPLALLRYVTLRALINTALFTKICFSCYVSSTLWEVIVEKKKFILAKRLTVRYIVAQVAINHAVLRQHSRNSLFEPNKNWIRNSADNVKCLRYFWKSKEPEAHAPLKKCKHSAQVVSKQGLGWGGGGEWCGRLGHGGQGAAKHVEE
jgi:hypothetical protein